MKPAMVERLEARTLLTTYYISATGSDSAVGTSQTAAWRTIAKANTTDLDPGDKILFRGGQTFTIGSSLGTELVTNGSFSSGLTGWSDTRGTGSTYSTITTASGTYHTASSALKISGAGSGARAQDVTSKVRPNQAYVFRAWTKHLNGNPSTPARVGVRFYKSGLSVGHFYYWVGSPSWFEQAWSFVAPASFDKAIVYAERLGTSSSYYVDDISLKQIAQPLVLNQSDAGTWGKPVTIGSYGTGRATIDARDGIAISANNVGGLVIQDLNLRGKWDGLAGAGTNVGNGLEINNTLAGGGKLSVVRVTRVDVQGFRWAGISLNGHNGKSGFRDVRITECTSHGNGDVGITTGGEFNIQSTGYAHEDVYIGRCRTYDNGGIPNKGSNSGNGILISDANRGTVERNVAHHNGKYSNYAFGGPVGIWAWDANAIVIQKNESYANATGSTKDGGGFDLDGGVTNSILRHNYSHDNEGPGYLLYQYSGARAYGKNIVAFNISQNDGRDNSYGAISIGGGSGMVNTIIERNTIYMSPSSRGAVYGMRITGTGSGVHVRNNIIQTAGGVPVVYGTGTSATFIGNDYYSSDDRFAITWNGVTYDSLSAWRNATGRERDGTVATGRDTDPGLRNAGGGGVLNDASRLEYLDAYALRSDSRLIDQGRSLSAPFSGYAWTTSDFFGRSSKVREQDIGACESA